MRKISFLVMAGVVFLSGSDVYASNKGQSGEAQESLRIGLAFRDGTDRPNDDVKAAYWLEKSARQGNSKAQLALGGLYSLGRGVPEDIVKAYSLYGQAARNGEPVAQWLVGQSYELGIVHKPDTQKALFWYRKAAESNEPNAQAALGWIYYSGKWGEKVDYAKARTLFEQAGSRDRLGEAEVGMAELYRFGRAGMPQSDQIAFDWYMKAAVKNHRVALNCVGGMYHEGRGVKKSDSMALFYWARTANEYNDPYAQYMLSQVLSKGERVKIDLPNAYFFALKAYRNGFPEAQSAVEELEPKLSDNEKREMLKVLDRDS